MVKIIETNISIDNGSMVDFQSRVIEMNSWQDFIDEVTSVESVTRSAAIGVMYGTTIPRNARVENLEWNSSTLKCDIYNYCNAHSKKLAYLISE